MVNKLVAGILSFFVPGIGQALAGNARKGILYLLIAVALVVIQTYIFKTWIFTIVRLLFALFAGYDAYVMARSQYI